MKLKGLIEMFKATGYDGPERRRPVPDYSGCRVVMLALAAFWMGIALMVYSCSANAGRGVFLEDEQDLGNGFKLCIYSEGITITVPSHSLCPISIEV